MQGSGAARLHVEIEVAELLPGDRGALGRRLYALTQSRIHVLITRGFLRSLARLDLAESRMGDADGLRRRAGGRALRRRYPRSAASLARSWVARMRRIVPERVRMTSDSVVAPPALG